MHASAEGSEKPGCGYCCHHLAEFLLIQGLRKICEAVECWRGNIASQFTKYNDSVVGVCHKVRYRTASIGKET